MQYFKDELWTLMNVGTEEEQQTAEEEWDRNALAYWVRDKNLEGRVSKRVHQFFRQRGFHDWRLVHFEIVHDRYGVKHPVKVLVTVENHSERWQLQYNKVTQVKVDYTEEIARLGFDDWGYDELLDVG